MSSDPFWSLFSAEQSKFISSRRFLSVKMLTAWSKCRFLCDDKKTSTVNIMTVDVLTVDIRIASLFPTRNGKERNLADT